MWIGRLCGLLALLVAAFVTLVGSGGGGGGDPARSSAEVEVNELAASCSDDLGVADVFDLMRFYYFWNDQPDQQEKYFVPGLENFSDSFELLDFLRYRPDRFDRNFTYLTTVIEDEAFFETAQTAAFGIGIREAPGALWLTDAFSGSPAIAAGLSRGDRIVAVDGRSISLIQSAEGVAAALGPSRAGVTRTLDIEFAAGGVDMITLTKAVFSIDPVPDDRVRTYDVAGRTIGYLQLRSFVRAADEQLRSTFATLGSSGIQDLVVDLRYNGGGLLSTAQVFGSLLAGPGSPGLTFADLLFNSELAADGFNDTLEFLAESSALDLDNLVFITTGASASASELVINSLEPYAAQLGFTVRIVGQDTFGKPVGQGGVDFCPDPGNGRLLLRLRIVAFESVNVLGEGGYFDGLPVDCAADDDLGQPLGDPAEASLATALALIETGSCPAGTTRVEAPVAVELERPAGAGGTAARLAGVW